MTKPSEEQWRAIPGYEGLYEVSDWGRVRSLHPQFYGRIRSLTPHRQGYLGLHLNRGPSGRVFELVHRLVAGAFCERPEGAEIVRHLDGDKRHNRPANLAWGDRHENALDSIRHGTHSNASKTHCLRDHPFDLENTNDNGGRRRCLACTRERAARYRAKQKAAGVAAA